MDLTESRGEASAIPAVLPGRADLFDPSSASAALGVCAP